MDEAEGGSRYAVSLELEGSHMKPGQDCSTLVRIPREEVEEIAACVMEHLGAFIEGCEYTICGGSVPISAQENALIAGTEEANRNPTMLTWSSARQKTVRTSVFYASCTSVWALSTW